MRRAVTLLELLVVIAVIGVLIAIGLPILRTAQQSARTAACLANIREVGRAAAVYAGEHAGQMPYLAERKHLDDAFDIGLGPQGHFDQHGLWPHALREYLGKGPRPAACYCPWYPGLGSQTDRSLATGQAHQFPNGVAFPSGYMYNAAFFTGPDLWRRSDPVVDGTQLRPVQLSSTRHPSSKLVFYGGARYHLIGWSLERVRDEPKFYQWTRRQPWTSVFADGAGHLVHSDDALHFEDPPKNPFRPDSDGRVLLYTVDGYLGRDF